MRILIAGGPKCGKTTFAATLGLAVRHTDDLIGTMSWSDVSDHVASRWMMLPGEWCIEGVTVARAIRKWLDANANGKPADRVYHMPEAKIELDARQEGMRKSCLTVFNEIRPELMARGCLIITK